MNKNDETTALRKLIAAYLKFAKNHLNEAFEQRSVDKWELTVIN